MIWWGPTVAWWRFSNQLEQAGCWLWETLCFFSGKKRLFISTRRQRLLFTCTMAQHMQLNPPFYSLLCCFFVFFLLCSTMHRSLRVAGAWSSSWPSTSTPTLRGGYACPPSQESKNISRLQGCIRSHLLAHPGRLWRFTPRVIYQSRTSRANTPPPPPTYSHLMSYIFFLEQKKYLESILDGGGRSWRKSIFAFLHFVPTPSGT